MRTALDAPLAALDEEEKAFVATIREHGWFRTGILSDAEAPSFSFTTGFWINAHHPELAIFNMQDAIAHQVFWDVFLEAKAGRGIPVGRRTDAVFSNLPAYAFTVAKRHYADHLGWSRWFYGGDDFPCLQIVWPDRTGLFPWEGGFDPEFEGNQPDLTERGWINEIAD